MSYSISTTIMLCPINSNADYIALSNLTDSLSHNGYKTEIVFDDTFARLSVRAPHKEVNRFMATDEGFTSYWQKNMHNIETTLKG